LKNEHLGNHKKADTFMILTSLLKELDPSSNGYVTNKELEDVMKHLYPALLNKYDLKACFQKYASI
jgi:hypothetical protein